MKFKQGLKKFFPFLKKQVRKDNRAKREALSQDEIFARSFELFQNYLSHQNVIFALLPKDYHAHGGKKPVIGLYAEIKNEISTREFFRHFHQLGIKTAYPRICPSINGDEIEFYLTHSLDELRPGTFGINEPKPHIANKIEPDIVFVPGVAFDRRGLRVGYGKGFYDRYFSKHQALKVGLAYSFQILDQISDQIEEQPHDIKMDLILTETELHAFAEMPYYYALHEEACSSGDDHYFDPKSHLKVFTRLHHRGRGFCCKSGCRHCPYGYRR